MAPDWENNASYNRLNTDVIEMPIDQSCKLVSSFSKEGHTIYKKEYSQSSFLIFKRPSGYEAYIMTVIADSAYVNGDLSKLKNNTYRKHDSDFSGIVLYFTPKGKFLKSWGYKNGNIVPQVATLAAPSQSKNNNKMGTLTYQAPVTLDCLYFFWDITLDGVLISREFLFKICTPEGGSGGAGGDGGTSPTVAPPCSVDTTITNSTGHLSVMGNHDPIGGDPGPGDGGDGGFPPPPTNTTTSVHCKEVPPDIKDSVKSPCSLAKSLLKNNKFISNMKDLQSKVTLANEVGYVIDNNDSYSYVQGTAGTASINLNVSSPLNGYIHTHYTGTFPTFSGSDIKVIYQLQQKGLISNISTFMAGVVTANGTTYILKISDSTQFASFAAQNLNNETNFKSFEDFYANNQKVNSLLGLDYVSSYESALLTALSNSGLTLLQGNNSFSAWNVKGLVNNVLTVINCN